MYLPHLRTILIAQMSDESLIRRYEILKARRHDLRKKGYKIYNGFHQGLAGLFGQKAPQLSDRALAILSQFSDQYDEETKAVLVQVRKRGLVPAPYNSASQGLRQPR